MEESFLMKHRTRERGQVLPLVAISIAVLLGFAGMAIDVGYLEYQQRQQQNATDAAAIGGAQQLIYAGCSNSQTVATTAADNDAATNGYTNGTNDVVVKVNNPPSSGPYASNNCSVQVQITNQNTQTFFMKLFGHANVTESTQAVATVESNNDGCIYLLNPSAYSGFNGGTVDAPACGIVMNGSANFNAGTITAPSIGYAGSTPNYGDPDFTDAHPQKMLPLSDPCPEIAGCAYLAANPPTIPGNCQTVNTNGVSPYTLAPGCYSGLNLDNSVVNMSPGGLYIITGNINTNGATINGSGVTLYVTDGATANFDGASVNLSPPTTGNYAGVLYYQVPSDTAGPNFNGPTSNLSGLLYAPGANVNFNGGSGNYVVMVFGSLNLNGGQAIDLGTPPAGESLIKNVVLTQ
jgi:Flp pilus assembly protein TadG